MKLSILTLGICFPIFCFSQSIQGSWKCIESVKNQPGETYSWERNYAISDEETVSTEWIICKKNGIEYIRSGTTFYLKMASKSNYFMYLRSIFSLKEGETIKTQWIDDD